MTNLHTNTYEVEEGPRSGFSLKGWKENRPRKRAIQETEFLGQLLTYIVIMNITILAMTKEGIIQGAHFLKCLTCVYITGLEAVEDCNWGVWLVSISTGCTALYPLILIWTCDDWEGGGWRSWSFSIEGSRVQKAKNSRKKTNVKTAKRGNACGHEKKALLVKERCFCFF